MSKKNITQAVTNIVAELEAFSSEERQRIVRASLTLLGDSSANLGDQNEDGLSIDVELPAKARGWLKQYGISQDQISQVFHRSDDGMEIIAQIPGATKREQVRNAYVLSGIARLLATGETKFDDKSARRLCELGGFFDGTNHMKYMKGSEFTGSRDKGWVLTAPGLRHGATLVSELAQ